MDDVEMALVEARGAAGTGLLALALAYDDSGEWSGFGGRGKRDFFLFLRGSLKRVVVVEMVWVVVVVA